MILLAGLAVTIPRAAISHAAPPAGPDVVAPAAPVSAPPAAAGADATAASTSPLASATPLEILQNPDAPQDARDNAARLLVAGHSDADRPALVAILKNNDNHASQLAVARALALDTWTVPDFIDPLFTLLGGADPNRARAAADALAQYKTNLQVLNRLIAVANRTGIEETRVAVIRAIGTFDQKIAAQTLIDLQSRNDSIAIQQAAGDALMDMTGLRENGHDAARWQQWFAKLQNLNEQNFHAALQQNRADHFEQEVARRTQLDAAVAKLLSDLYLQAPDAQRADIVIRYLRSSAPEIRALGASIVYQSRQSLKGAPATAMAEVRGMLGDSSVEVRAAAAQALYNDPDSVAAMTAQLQHENDDDVLVALIDSLGPLHDPSAVDKMLQLLQNASSTRVRIEAAKGVGMGAALMQANGNLRQNAVNILKQTLDNTNTPATQGLREACAAALAEIPDQSLLTTYRQLISPSETVAVRIDALHGMGNLKNPDVGQTIGNNYLEDPNPDIRLAAVQAVGTVPQPLLIDRLLQRMQNDPEPAVRTAIWQDLQSWLKSLADSDLSTLAEGLKHIDPIKELQVRLALRDQLAQENQAAPNSRTAIALATQEEDIGDLMMAQNQPDTAIAQYQAALDFWKTNQGTFDVKDRLTGDVVRAMLAAKRWNDAAEFTSAVIKQYRSDPDMAPTQETVSKEFKLAAEALRDSNKPTAATDAEALKIAVSKMEPPLVAPYLDFTRGAILAIEQKQPGHP
jgi:HEAT repeat protein